MNFLRQTIITWTCVRLSRLLHVHTDNRNPPPEFNYTGCYEVVNFVASSLPSPLFLVLLMSSPFADLTLLLLCALLSVFYCVVDDTTLRRQAAFNVAHVEFCLHATGADMSGLYMVEYRVFAWVDDGVGVARISALLLLVGLDFELLLLRWSVGKNVHLQRSERDVIHN